MKIPLEVSKWYNNYKFRKHITLERSTWLVFVTMVQLFFKNAHDTDSFGKINLSVKLKFERCRVCLSVGAVHNVYQAVTGTNVGQVIPEAHLLFQTYDNRVNARFKALDVEAEFSCFVSGKWLFSCLCRDFTQQLELNTWAIIFQQRERLGGGVSAPWGISNVPPCVMHGGGHLRTTHMCHHLLLRVNAEQVRTSATSYQGPHRSFSIWEIICLCCIHFLFIKY